MLLNKFYNNCYVYFVLHTISRFNLNLYFIFYRERNTDQFIELYFVIKKRVLSILPSRTDPNIRVISLILGLGGGGCSPTGSH